MCISCYVPKESRREAMQFIRERVRNMPDSAVIGFANLIEETASIDNRAQCCSNRQQAEELLAGFFWRGQQVRNQLQQALDDALGAFMKVAAQHAAAA